MKGYLLIKDTNIYISAIDLVYFHVVLEGNLFLCVLLSSPHFCVRVKVRVSHTCVTNSLLTCLLRVTLGSGQVGR